MSIGALLLLLSAFLHALWNALAKASQDKEAFLFMTILQSGVYTLLVSWFLHQPISFSTDWAFKIAVLSGIFEGLYFLTLSKALKVSSLGVSYAIMRGGAMVWVWSFSLIFLKEDTSLLHLVGTGVILIGILVLNAKDLFAKDRTSLKNNIWAYLSSISIAGYHLCYHEALQEGTNPESVFSVAMVVSLPFLLFSIRKNTFARLHKTLSQQGPRVFATAVFATSSFLIFLYGLKISAPGFAISLRNTSIFFALVFSILLKESLSRYQIAGALAIAAGAFILSC